MASAWHTRVLEDEVVSHAFSHGYHPQHTERLAAYWAEALGGPTTYSDQYADETSVVRMHSGNGPHEEMDRRAIACFDQALEDVGLAHACSLPPFVCIFFLGLALLRGGLAFSGPADGEAMTQEFSVGEGSLLH